MQILRNKNETVIAQHRGHGQIQSLQIGAQMSRVANVQNTSVANDCVYHVELLQFDQMLTNHLN